MNNYTDVDFKSTRNLITKLRTAEVAKFEIKFGTINKSQYIKIEVWLGFRGGKYNGLKLEIEAWPACGDLLFNAMPWRGGLE